MHFTQLKDVVYLLILVGTPLVSVTGAFYTGQQHLADYRLEVEQKFAHKDDISKMSDKINLISNDVSEIKGMLKATTRQSAGVSRAEPFVSQSFER